MKVTYNWLKEFVDFDQSPEQLADLLTMLGLEVEGMENYGAGMDQVVVAVVEEKRQHPNADKLSVCRVNNGREIVDVVCGAQNFKAGDIVALAQIGAVLPGDFKIKRSKIRGEESCGMLCSEKELGLAEESAGIMILPPTLVPGTPVFESLGLKDTFFEIGLTPNRADCLSVIGVAREIAAKIGTSVKCNRIAVPEHGPSINSSITVSVEDSELCPRYAARAVHGCRIAPSPEWLVNRLAAVGVRSINNVVDVTNLVMMELGQPLHAFDCDQLVDSRIVVRRALEGEIFTTLDSQQRVLVASDLVICDAGGPVALAGIMGGENSEINDSTTSILLESAWFKPAAIRTTSKRLGLHTESSHRFERGTDIDGVIRALDRAAALVAELAGGTVAQGFIDVYPVKSVPPAISFRPERANALLGIKLSSKVMIDILRGLECSVTEMTDGILMVTPPSYRIDIEREIDLVEEIARLNGYDNIPASMPIARVISDRPSLHQRLESMLRNILVAHGMNEIINFSFTTPDAADKLLMSDVDPRRSVIKLANPLVEEQSVMRTSLIPGLLEAVAKNISHRSLDLRLFEMRRVYINRQNEEMPHEPIYLVGAFTGAREREGWGNSRDSIDFYDAKGVVENLLEELHISNVKWVVDTPETFYHPGKSCSIMVGKERLGTIGEIHPTVQKNFGLEKPVFCFELYFEKLVVLHRLKAAIVVPSRFPDSTRDLAMLASDCLSAEKILETVKGIKAQEIEHAEIFDVYKGAGIPTGFKSIAIRIRYRSYDRTLTDDEINIIHSRITENLVSKLKVSIR
ncbi:phenylalanine--tRNA ligase subunit beta [Pelotalea chapellei]|uniref:Phenylalanine--tRNA ligase beta subunit n=1 Tax=Pelotalea chapellei TaxID=44671 RepID=A0ABS5U3W6_9BACT|nr:phenylalanine--tRNA ligase subunit beta [Pelotalea chapellei]MBT1070367.1 phenylalanine--tRNA ligase subunit beta [Pelotalea chapellei]